MAVAPPFLFVLQAPADDDAARLFFLSILSVAIVAAFAFAVIAILLHRAHRRELAQEKLATMGTIAARILHQVKNPIQTILLQAELLAEFEREQRAEERREAGENILAESTRLAAMLNELSLWAAGSRRVIAPAPVRLDELVGALAQSQRPALEARGVMLETEVRARPVAMADAYYLRQALENLIRNADEALGERPGGRVRVELDQAGGDAVVRIADNGPGIPPAQQREIFEPFVTTKGTGMGLGLAICREIVEGHGGRLQLSSSPETGTTFSVHLPLANGSPAAAARGGSR